MSSNRSDTRSHLIDTATHLFLNKSYGTVSTSKICQEAEINKGTFYHFFPSKASLLIAALEQYTRQTIDRLHLIKSSELTPEQKLKAIFDVPNAINSQWKPTDGLVRGCLISNIGHELGTVDEQIRHATEKCMSQIMEAVKPTIMEFSENQNLGLEANAAAEKLIAMIQGSLTLAKVFNSPHYVTAMSSHAIALLRTQQDQQATIQ